MNLNSAEQRRFGVRTLSSNGVCCSVCNLKNYGPYIVIFLMFLRGNADNHVSS